MKKKYNYMARLNILVLVFLGDLFFIVNQAISHEKPTNAYRSQLIQTAENHKIKNQIDLVGKSISDALLELNRRGIGYLWLALSIILIFET